MSEISTNIILTGMTQALHKEFPKSQIHTEEVTQGLSDGDFIVVLVSDTRTQHSTGRRYKRSPLFDVCYFPAVGHEECYGIADRLSQLFEIIELPTGDKVRGTGMNFEIVDKVLHFKVTFGYTTMAAEKKEPMEELILSEEVNHG